MKTKGSIDSDWSEERDGEAGERKGRDVKLSYHANQNIDEGTSRSSRTASFIPDEHDVSHLPSWVRAPKQITNGHLSKPATANGAVLATLDENIPWIASDSEIAFFDWIVFQCVCFSGASIGDCARSTKAVDFVIVCQRCAEFRQQPLIDKSMLD